MGENVNCLRLQHVMFWGGVVGWCLVLAWGTLLPVAAAETGVVMEEVSYTTEDNLTIYGSWIRPQPKEPAAAPAPAVILLHDYGFDRRDWSVLIPDLVQRGISVLAIDLRGHGKSTEGGQRIAQGDVASAAAYTLQHGYKDVLGALEWVQKQKTVQPKQISLVGAGLGGDIAYFCARKFSKRLRSTVVISPSIESISEGSFADSAARAILICASSGDANGSSMIAAESMVNFSAQPKKLVVYQSAAHGLALFYKHPELKLEILGWLR